MGLTSKTRLKPKTPGALALPRIAGRIFGVPLAIRATALDTIVAAIGPRLKGASADWGTPDENEDDGSSTWRMTDDGIAMIPICGELVTRAGGLHALSGLRSYDSIADDLSEAANDPRCRGILLSFDSPGGEVQGMFDLAESIYRASLAKPVYAYAGPAYSAAYMLASAAGRVIVPQDSGVGSIGVLALHLDESQADEDEGLKYTAIYAGARKNDGNPHEPLTDPARARLQSAVDKLYGMFTAAVGRYRDVPQVDVQATEAMTYIGQDCIAVGLADDVGTEDDALSMLRAALNENSAPRTMRTIGFASGDRPGTKVPVVGRDRAEADAPAPTSSAASAARKEPHMAEGTAAESKMFTAAEVETMVAEARKSGQSAAVEIANLCLLAGCPSKAAEFIGDNKPPQQVRAELLKARAAAQDSNVVDPAIVNKPGDPGTEQNAPAGKAKPWGDVLQALGLKKREDK